jgi:hypothetical protein
MGSLAGRCLSDQMMARGCHPNGHAHRLVVMPWGRLHHPPGSDGVRPDAHNLHASRDSLVKDSAYMLLSLLRRVAERRRWRVGSQFHDLPPAGRNGCISSDVAALSTRQYAHVPAREVEFVAAGANHKPPVLHFHESSRQARRGALLCRMVSSRGRGQPSRRHLPRRWPTPGKATLDEIAHRLLIGGCAEKERKGDELAQHSGLCNVNRRQPVFARRRSYTTHCSPGGGTS